MTTKVFRFASARGVEYRGWGSSVWFQLTPNALASLDCFGLRAVAEAMQTGKEVQYDEDTGAFKEYLP